MGIDPFIILIIPCAQGEGQEYKTMETLRVRITFIEDLLGTAPNNKNIFQEFIASKAPDATTIEEEVAAVGVDAVTEKGITVFPRTKSGKPFIYDYQWKGFFKETASFLKKDKTTKTSKIKAFKKEIDGCVFIEKRKNIINLSGDITLCQRSLRASTPQGERTSLACSESIPALSTTEFTVLCMLPEYPEYVIEWLEYGYYHGTGQWRNSSKGRFVYQILDEKGDVIGGNYEKLNDYLDDEDE